MNCARAPFMGISSQEPCAAHAVTPLSLSPFAIDALLAASTSSRGPLCFGFSPRFVGGSFFRQARPKARRLVTPLFRAAFSIRRICASTSVPGYCARASSRQGCSASPFLGREGREEFRSKEERACFTAGANGPSPSVAAPSSSLSLLALFPLFHCCAPMVA